MLGYKAKHKEEIFYAVCFFGLLLILHRRRPPLCSLKPGA